LQSTQPKEINIGHCLERMARIPDAIAVARQTLTHPPKPILETAILQNRGAISFYETEIFQFAGENAATRQAEGRRRTDCGRLEVLPEFPGGRSDGARHGDWRLGREEVFAQARSGARRGRDRG